MPLHLTGALVASGLYDLPWDEPLEQWPPSRLVGLPRGISRHVVRFVQSDDAVYAVKELGEHAAQREYAVLRDLARSSVPCVQPAALVEGRRGRDGEPLEPALVTRHLEFSLPYRALLSQTLRPATAGRLLDALAVLLVRLHLSGFYWGDCSLSNTLFRRDAGSFAAYLVDAETAERHEQLSPGQRTYDLDMARTNIIGELMDLQEGELLETGVDPIATGDTIARRYRALWDALTEQELVPSGERYRVDARIRQLNDLGFDVAELDIMTGFVGDLVRIRPKVVDAGHHARRLLRVTGLDGEENQARRLLNDLDAFAAAVEPGADNEQLVAQRWLGEVFRPVVLAVPPQLRAKLDSAEIFHEVLEHRWFLSEEAGEDVGVRAAVEGYVRSVLPGKPDERALLAEPTTGAELEPEAADQCPNPSAPVDPLGFGTATSSYQVEGAVDVDGRGPSIWDTFCGRPGTVLDGSSGAVACRSYERYDEDLDLVAGLGIGSYRFSIAWPRVQPTGSGAVVARGLDHYDRVVDGLLARGVRPTPTLYHWDLPQPLEDAGGWPVRDTALRFVDYAQAVAARLGDRVSLWSTLNEPWCSAFLGYAAGVHAPGRRDPEAALAAAHHLLLAHGLAARALREQTPGLDVGIVLNLAPVRPEPAVPEGVADLVDAVQNGLWLEALVDGRYPEVLIERSTGLREVVREGDLAAIAGSADWLGVNYYTPLRPGPPGGGSGVGQAADAYPYTVAFGFHPRPPYTAMHWEVDGTGLDDVLRTVAARAPRVPLRVTENGASFPDDRHDAAGAVVDEDRIAYLDQHLAAVDRAREAGVPVLDYFAWSLLDNFEWAEGYTQTFGLVSVDADSGARTPKASYAWFRERVAGR